MVDGTDVFIRVALVDDKGKKINQLLNLSAVERFSDEADDEKRGGLTTVYLKQKSPTKAGVEDLVIYLSTPIDKVMERLIAVNRLNKD